VIEVRDVVEGINRLVAPFLARQRWFSGSDAPSSVTVIDQEVWKDGWPALVEVLIEADGAVYQVPLGLRPAGERPEFLRGRDDAILGELEVGGSAALAYDAIADPELCMALLDVVGSSKETAERVRPVGGEQSNTSLVFDERLILKVFRRIHPGRNLDVEVTEALGDVGFDHVARPVATLTRTFAGSEYDLAVVQPFLTGAVDGWALALTSLRDLFGVGDTQPVPVIRDDMPPPEIDPAQAGGDFSAEARRLGTITAGMHAAMCEAFGSEPGDARSWAMRIGREVEAAAHPEFDKAQAQRVVERLARVRDAGPAIRVHGDYHLGQVLRADAGWFVLDFEGEPARPPAERRQRSSPLKDVAGMLRSFHYASSVAGIDRDADCATLASAWEDRNRRAFLDGYARSAGKAGLLPAGDDTAAVLAGFELEKAVYELGYEQSYRPDWVTIPLAALQRLGAA
jgi:maltokinase